MLFFRPIKLVARVLACVCVCDRMHQMEKTVAQTSVMFCSGFIISISPPDSNTFDV